jgi:hypothetical protein
VSESKSEEKAQVNAQEGLEFFEALKGYLAKNPKSMIWLLHIVADDASDALRETDDLYGEIHHVMGRVKALDEVLWENDSNDILLSVISSPEILPIFMKAIAELATAFAMVRGNDSIDTSALRDKINDAWERLNGILRTVMKYAEERACQDP